MPETNVMCVNSTQQIKYKKGGEVEKFQLAQPIKTLGRGSS